MWLPLCDNLEREFTFLVSERFARTNEGSRVSVIRVRGAESGESGHKPLREVHDSSWILQYVGGSSREVGDTTEKGQLSGRFCSFIRLVKWSLVMNAQSSVVRWIVAGIPRHGLSATPNDYCMGLSGLWRTL